jgi:hypothetical protein
MGTRMLGCETSPERNANASVRAAESVPQHRRFEVALPPVRPAPSSVPVFRIPRSRLAVESVDAEHHDNDTPTHNPP